MREAIQASVGIRLSYCDHHVRSTTKSLIASCDLKLLIRDRWRGKRAATSSLAPGLRSE